MLYKFKYSDGTIHIMYFSTYKAAVQFALSEGDHLIEFTQLPAAS